VLSHVKTSELEDPEPTEPVVELEPAVVVEVAVVEVEPVVPAVPVAEPVELVDVVVACSFRTPAVTEAVVPAAVPEDPEDVVVVVEVVVEGDVVVEPVVVPVLAVADALPVVVAIVVDGVAVVVDGVLVVDDGVVVVVVVDTPALPVESALPVVSVVDVPVLLEPAVVDEDELEDVPTSALLVPAWLPASEKLAPEPEADEDDEDAVSSLPLDVEDTTLVMGSVSVDVVCDCTYTGHVVAADAECVARLAAALSSSTRRVAFIMLLGRPGGVSMCTRPRGKAGTEWGFASSRALGAAGREPK
jgi:hypothetical protein